MTCHVLVAAKDYAPYGGALKELIERLCGSEIEVLEVRADPEHFLAEFDRVALALDTKVTSKSGLVVWACPSQLDGESPTSSSCSYDALCRLAILTFPDVQWNILPTPGSGDAAPRYFAAHALASLAAGLQRAVLAEEPMLDTTLQDSLRRRTNGDDGGMLPIRELWAAAIDEEDSYAYFNAYVAFRFGWRARVINSAALLGERFGPAAPPLGLSAQFEDLYLGFPDKGRLRLPEGAHLSDLRVRDSLLPRLTQARHRVLVTVGHRQSPGVDGNRAYLRDRSAAGQDSCTLFKPIGGMYALWRDSGLWREMRQRGGSGGFAPGFSLPQVADTGDVGRGHSAPGRLLLVATRLIARAEARLGSVRTVKDAVGGAVLATHAAELLQHRTPTTALEALSLKHCFEVLAECEFEGVERMIDLDSRFEEIRLEAEAIGRWFHPGRGRRSVLNARLKIAARLALLFRERNHFDEEQACNAEARDLYQQLWFARRPWLRVFQPGTTYVNALLRSLPLFGLCIFLWVVGLAALYWAVAANNPGLCEARPELKTFGGALTAALEGFLGLQKSGAPFVWVDALVLLGGFVHLGVFISHLYSVASRR